MNESNYELKKVADRIRTNMGYMIDDLLELEKLLSEQEKKI